MCSTSSRVEVTAVEKVVPLRKTTGTTPAAEGARLDFFSDLFAALLLAQLLTEEQRLIIISYCVCIGSLAGWWAMPATDRGPHIMYSTNS